jgi:hypothetical protein
MPRFWRGIAAYPHVAIGDKFIGNILENPAGFSPTIQLFDEAFIAIVIPDGATSDDQGPAFTCQNNRISGVTIGIVFSADQSNTNTLAEFAVSYNLITEPFQTRLGLSDGSYMGLEQASLSLAVPQNW